MYLAIMKFDQSQTLPYRTLIFPEKNLFLIEFLNKIYIAEILLRKENH